MKKTVICILGNQLFDLKHLPVKAASDVTVFMREDRELCTHFKYHKHKLVFFLSAMRKYAEELREAGYDVHYERLEETKRETYDHSLKAFLKEVDASRVVMFEIEDKFFESRLNKLLLESGAQVELIQSPMFLTTRETFRSYLSETKRPFMKTFYERQRKRLKILMNTDKEPVGGQWSFDEENRLPLPKDVEPPSLPNYEPDFVDLEVMDLIEREFPDHPGSVADFWLPTDRAGAKKWARDFFDLRFENFGPYEDAFSKESPFVFHSVLTPFLNTGLITPQDCVTVALKTAKDRKVPLNSCEGYIRQVIGWREFVRGIYQNFSEIQDVENAFQHTRKLSKHWYDGTTGIEPLDDVIRKTNRYAYAHHIERLMVVGSLMVLLEIDPREAHKWFMEMFIDSSDWVMGPNVYGMAVFSDGGIFATKPYICGSNYYRKMGHYKKAEWMEAVDGLYWSFIERNQTFFLQNPRLSMMARTLDRMDPEKKKRLWKAADQLRDKLS